MSTFKNLKGIAMFMPLFFMSCNNDINEIANSNDFRIYFAMDDFDQVSESRTTIHPDKKYSVTWAKGDVIGIFPYEGYQEPFEIPDNQAESGTATFDGGYWELKDGLKYNAYYPFDKVNFDSPEMKTKIPVSYEGQKQIGASCCVGSHAFTYSDWATAGDGSVYFQFHHIGSLVVITLPIPVTTSYSNLTIEAENAIIPIKGTYDLTAKLTQGKDPSFVADASSLSKSISVELTDFTGTAKTNATIYMMLPPVDLSSKTLTLTLKAKEGGSCVYSVAGQNVLKGKKTEFTGTPTSSSVAGTTHDWLVENGIIPEGDYFEVDVNTAGNLSQTIIKNGTDKLSIVESFAKGLKISGNLNGTDIDYLRKAFPNLQALDLSNANIVAGGISYYTNEWGNKCVTIDNEFPQYFMTESDLTNLEYIVLPNSVKKIGYSAFVDVFTADGSTPISTYKLKNVILGNNLEEIGEIPFACSITSIHIPANVTKVGTAAFGYCPYLESITVAEENTKFKSIDGVLYEIGERVWITGTGYIDGYWLNVCPPGKGSFCFTDKIYLTAIGSRAFSDCKFLTDIVIPETVTSLSTAVFARCTALKSVTIPASVVYFNHGTNFWYTNPAMEELHLKHETPPSWYFQTSSDNLNGYLPTTCKLYVPYTEGWRYSSTNKNNWNKYFSIQYIYE